MNANAAYAELKERLAEIADLDGASSLLGWDQQVKMPPGGAARAPSSSRPSVAFRTRR